MKFSRLHKIVILVITVIVSSCRREPIIDRIETFEWLETQILTENGDSQTTIRPQNEAEILRLVLYYGERDIMKFYRGNKFLSECEILDGRFADGSETTCITEDFCYTLNCDLQICYSSFHGDTIIIHEIPFLDGSSGSLCQSASLFKAYSSPIK